MKNKTSPVAPKRAFDSQKAQKAIKLLLEALGEDTNREGLLNTPKRVAEFYKEALSGKTIDPVKLMPVHYGVENHDEIVLVKDISMHSLCEHHLLPFYGKAHIAYLPDKDRLVGVSNLVKVVEAYAQRLQIQERLTKQIADAIMKAAKPRGVMVVIEAEQLCMTMRGVKKPGSKMITSAVRGVFMDDASTRAEALSLIKA
ncbi:MAG: GTP cyclohydrolase I FolE [Elusimicrobia bacterium]|nr:GTP cyclohydrolase I FolE [Elusimicrobiota bacterium]